MRLRAKVFSGRLITAGAIAAGAALSPLTDASAAQQQVRAVAVQRAGPRPAAPRQTFQRTVVQHTVVQHNVITPNAVRRAPPNFVNPGNPNPGFNPNAGFNPNRGNLQQFNNPQFNNPQRLVAPGPGGRNVVGGPGNPAINGLRLGPGRPGIPNNLRLAPGPGGLPLSRPNFPVVTVNNRFFPIARGQRFVWFGGYRRTFVPLGILGVVLIGGSYWYPDGYVSLAQPFCGGLTPDGCQLTWRMVDFEDGGGAPQCVQYCPQVGQRHVRYDDLRRSEFRRPVGADRGKPGGARPGRLAQRNLIGPGTVRHLGILCRREFRRRVDAPGSRPLPEPAAGMDQADRLIPVRPTDRMRQSFGTAL
jgi:hypothetical protein